MSQSSLNGGGRQSVPGLVITSDVVIVLAGDSEGRGKRSCAKLQKIQVVANAQLSISNGSGLNTLKGGWRWRAGWVGKGLLRH